MRATNPRRSARPRRSPPGLRWRAPRERPEAHPHGHHDRQEHDEGIALQQGIDIPAQKDAQGRTSTIPEPGTNGPIGARAKVGPEGEAAGPGIGHLRIHGSPSQSVVACGERKGQGAAGNQKGMGPSAGAVVGFPSARWNAGRYREFRGRRSIAKAPFGPLHSGLGRGFGPTDAPRSAAPIAGASADSSLGVRSEHPGRDEARDGGSTRRSGGRVDAARMAGGLAGGPGGGGRGPGRRLCRPAATWRGTSMSQGARRRGRRRFTRTWSIRTRP